jgi:hypothetical protein
MKSYRKVKNCGPVAYPDQSGRYLRTETETVTGDEWEPLVKLGFVEVCIANIAKPAETKPPKTTYKVLTAVDSKSADQRQDIQENTVKSKTIKIKPGASILDVVRRAEGDLDLKYSKNSDTIMDAVRIAIRKDKASKDKLTKNAKVANGRGAEALDSQETGRLADAERAASEDPVDP